MIKFVNSVLENIWKDRYQKNGETLEENLHRVSKYVATNDVEEKEFYNVMSKGLFFPAGRTMSNAGIGKTLTLNNCFVAPQIQDSLDDIFDKVKLGATTHQKGGGIGYDFSQLRPKGSRTSNDAIASGAVSFMDVFNAQTDTILQGNRRGANMGVMNIYSMDIVDFIEAKSHDSKTLDHFNVSVMVDDKFMKAVQNNANVWLHYPVYDDNGKILEDSSKWQYKKEVNARELWDLIMKKAYDNGEPGVFFYDNLNKDNNLNYIENIVCSNPCAEYLAGTVYGINPKTNEKLRSNEFGGACNLGSLFLYNFVEHPFESNATVNYDLMKQTIRTAVRFLDNIIDINNFPDKIYENYQKSFRTIGLGVTGFADMLAMLGIKYNSEKARLFAFDLMNFIAFNAYEASSDLAAEKGSFPFLDVEKFVNSGYITKHCRAYSDWEKLRTKILQQGIRNAKILSVAPTGTLSLTFGNNCSSGIEPIFSLEYDRKVKVGGQQEENVEIVKMMDYAYYLWQNDKSPNNVVSKDVFVTAMDMDVNDHVEMLANIAWHVDMSVSKTINVPTEYSFEDTKNIYMKCWKSGIKGCTIFRPNEIRQGVLITNTTKKADNTETEIKSVKELKRGDIILVNDDVIGKKRKLTTGCGSLHCTAFFDPITGDLMETYFSKGSTGGCNNFMIGLSRIISLVARAGCDIYTIADQLNSCGVCPSYAVRTATKRDTSKGSCCPAAIGNALIDMYEEMQEELGLSKEDLSEVSNPIPTVEKMESDKQLVKPEINSNSDKNFPECPQCGEPLVFEGGCNICKSCGWSKCN